MRDGGLQGVEAVVERQQGMPSERNNDGLFLNRQDCRLGFLRPVGRSETEVRAFYFATVFVLTP